MSVIDFPYNKPKPACVVCVLCGRTISVSDATIGPINAKGEISLLCNDHLSDGIKLIDDLADYLAEERRKFFFANKHNLIQFGTTL